MRFFTNKSSRSSHNRRSRRPHFQSLETRKLLAGSLSLGTNLSEIRDYSASAFADAFKQSREWETANVDLTKTYNTGVYNTGFSVAGFVDTNGWPLFSPYSPGGATEDQVFHTVIPVRGAGIYTLFAEGKGTLNIIGNFGLLNPSTPFQAGIEINLDGVTNEYELEIHDAQGGGGNGMLFVYFTVSDEDDPIRNLQLLPPTDSADTASLPFKSSYTDDLGVYGNLRFMDWLSTNNNDIVRWIDRTQPNDFTQATSAGVAIEHIVQLANQTGQNAWITIPAKADDDFVTQLATHLYQNLHSELKVFVEYSNETWNGAFQQSGYIQEQGMLLGFDTNPFQAGQKFHAKRSAEIWKTFERVFQEVEGNEEAPYPNAASDRLVKVLATQSANIGVIEGRMEALTNPALNPFAIMPDAIAIGAYFGGSIADDIVTNNEVDTITTDTILDRLQATLASPDLVNTVTKEVSRHKAVADKYGLWLITYEGGQHLVANGTNASIQTLTDKLVAANADERMYGVYQQYLSILRDGGVVLHSNFTNVYQPGRFGSWGLQENQDQPVSEAHKLRAVLDWAEENPATNLLPHARAGNDITMIDDGDGQETFSFDAKKSRDFDGQILSYQWFVNGQLVGSDHQLTLDVSIGLTTLTLVVTDNDMATSSDEVKISLSRQQAAQNLVTADFSGATPANFVWTNGYTAPDVQYSGVTLGKAVPQGIGTVPFTGFTPVVPTDAPNWIEYIGQFPQDLSTLNDAINENEYFSFTVGADPSDPTKWLDLSGAAFSFAIARWQEHSAKQFAVMSSLGGFTANDAVLYETEFLSSFDYNSTRANPIRHDFSFSMPFDGFYTGDPIEFRIYAYGGRYNDKSSALSGLNLNGFVAPWPGPRDVVPSTSSINENTSTATADYVFATLAAVDPTPGDTHTFSLVGGTGSDDNSRFVVTDDRLYLKQGQIVDFESKASYEIRVRTTDVSNRSYEKVLVLGVNDLVEVATIGGVVINQGDEQRSTVRTVAVKFDGTVSVASDAFTIRNRATGATVAYTFPTPITNGATTVVNLSFSGNQTVSGSLNDGNYELIIHPTRVTSVTVHGLDANRNGVAGNEFKFGNEASQKFFRFYGDVNGDRTLNFTDFLAFRGTYGKAVGTQGYVGAFDYNGDGKISGAEFLQFRFRYGRSMPFSPPT